MKLSHIAACLLVTANIVSADTTDTTKTKKERVSLSEVIVTGDKIDRNLQETISSVEVFDEVDISNSSKLNEMFDLFEQTAGVNRTGKFTFNIRGINTTGITGTYSGPRTINVSVDGVSLGSNASKQGAISTWDIAQAEIIKGPQSTSQGRNSLAGAVNIKTNDPEFEANGATQASYGSNNTYQLSAMQTGAVSDNLALRFSVDRQHTDGTTTNDSFRGDKFNKRDVDNFRGKALYKFDNEATALLTVSKMRHDEKGNWQVDKNRKSINNTDGYYDTDAQAHSLEINYPINNNWSFKSISSYTNEKLDRLSDADNLMGIGTTLFDRENESKNQEFRLNYEGENSKSMIGIYHSQGKGTNDLFTNNYLLGPILVESLQYSEEKYKNSAIFFNADYYLNDKFTIILGARLDKDERENTSSFDSNRLNDLGSPASNAGADAQLDAMANGNASDKLNTTNFMPKLGFNYKWNENINTGFLFSQGYRPGGMSTNPISGETKKYDKEYTNNFELSFKSEWLEKKLILNSNIFLTKWKDQQVSERGSLGRFDVNTINAGESTLKGIEFNTKYLVNNNIDVYGNIGYVKAKFDKYKDGNTDKSGNHLIKTPEVTANVGINIRTNDGYFFGGNIAYTGSQYADSGNERKLDSYTLVNAKAGYEANDWSVYLYANNLFDKNYEVNDLDNGVYEFGDERIVGINFKYYW